MRATRWATTLALIPIALGAQKPSRKIEGELSGNAFFGNTRQVLASFRGEHERLDSTFAFRVLSRFNYGETTTDQTGTIVSKRSWNAGSSYDWHPFADFSPFIRASLESSLENKIDRRYSGGGGSRWNIARTPATDAIFSLGVNAERTVPLPPGDSLGSKTLARGFSNLRLRREFTPRVSATHETSYQPAFTSGGEYTVQSITATGLASTRSRRNCRASSARFNARFESCAESAFARRAIRTW